jgi:hypothetical protein
VLPILNPFEDLDLDRDSTILFKIKDFPVLASPAIEITATGFLIFESNSFASLVTLNFPSLNFNLNWNYFLCFYEMCCVHFLFDVLNEFDWITEIGGKIKFNI